MTAMCIETCDCSVIALVTLAPPISNGIGITSQRSFAIVQESRMNKPPNSPTSSPGNLAALRVIWAALLIGEGTFLILIIKVLIPNRTVPLAPSATSRAHQLCDVSHNDSHHVLFPHDDLQQIAAESRHAYAACI